MELAPGSVALSFEVTFDQPDLNVAMSVYDDSGSSPVLVQGPSAMALVAGNTYRGKFTATQGKNYIVIKAVYTDGTFTTLDPNYAQGSESIAADYESGGGGGSVIIDTPVIGFVINTDTVIGIVTCTS